MKDKFIINGGKKINRFSLEAPPMKMKEFSLLIKRTLVDNLESFGDDIRNKYNCSIWDDLKGCLYKVESDLASEILGDILVGYDYDICKSVKNDLKEFNLGRCNFSMISRDKTSGGIPYIEYTICYDFGPNVLIYIYHDGSNFRAFVPIVGNCINIETRRELYYDIDFDIKLLEEQKLGENLVPEELKYLFEKRGVSVDTCGYPMINYDECKKEFERNLKK